VFNGYGTVFQVANGMKYSGIIGLAFAAILILSISHLLWGSTTMDWGSLGSWFGSSPELAATVFFEVRLPRVLMAIAAGAGLGISGLMMQTWFHNPLAGPSVLGVTSGAGMAVALVVLTGMGGGWLVNSIAASVGSWLALALVWGVSTRFRGLASLLIFGLMLNYVLGALVTVLQAEAKENALQQFVFWGMGTFGQATLLTAGVVMLLVVIAIFMAFSLHQNLDKWTMGEITARSMGVDESRLRQLLILLTGLLAGSITAVCGPVAFLGLATPHLVKLLTPHRSHRRLIPMTALIGALLALVADWGVKGLGVFEGGWPLNAVLSLLGAPMVIWVLIKRNFTHS